MAVRDLGCSASAPSPHTSGWGGGGGAPNGCPELPPEVGQPSHLSLPPAPPGGGMAQGRVKLCRPNPLGSSQLPLEQRWMTPQGAGRGGPPQSASNPSGDVHPAKGCILGTP